MCPRVRDQCIQSFMMHMFLWNITRVLGLIDSNMLLKSYHTKCSILQELYYVRMVLVLIGFHKLIAAQDERHVNCK